MAGRHQKTAGPGRRGEEKKNKGLHEGAGHDASCRCREVSEMPPRKLLGLMFSDLAFWKKGKKR